MLPRIGFLVVLLALAGCLTPPDAPTSGPTGTAPQGPFSIASDAFQGGGAIPKSHACDGAGASPMLQVTGIPGDATHLALIVGDPDAPTPLLPQQNFTHWVVYDVPVVAHAVTFPEGRPAEGAKEGQNGSGAAGWTPPCPPPGPAHRYFFTAVALRAPLGLASGATRADVESAFAGREIARVALVGTYARQPI